MPSWLGGEGDDTTIDSSFHYAPGDSRGGSLSDPIITDSRLRANILVFKNDINTWTIHDRLGYFDMTESPMVPQTGLAIPTSLWSIETGATWKHNLGGGRSLSLDVGVGSDSDVPFHSINETILRTSASYRLPSGERNAWLFMLSYSNNRSFANNVPLPGVAYSFRTADNRFRGMIGFPFASVTYQPVQRWSVDASLFGPTVYHLETDIRLVGPVKLYGEFGRNQQMWLRANRDDNSNRLVFDEKKLGGGFRSPLTSCLSLDLSAGREFNRRFYENHEATNSGSIPEADIPSSWYGEARLSLRFHA
jgi:hypothetical protein